MKALATLAMFLTIIGALNWGLIGLGSYTGSNLNLVNLLFGTWPALEALVYLLVGLSGIMAAWVHMTGRCSMPEMEQ